MKRIPIFGLGCVAGAAGIARAADYVRAFPNEACLLLSVELCSLTVQQEDFSAANLISTGLFGDGAAAVLVGGSDFPAAAGPAIIATRSTFYPDTERVMGWDISEQGFQIVLSRDVPEVIRQNLGRDVDEFLEDNGLNRADIGNWVIHTGGPKVLEATQEALGLPDGALDVSWEMSGPDWESILGVRVVRTGRIPEESPAGTRHLGYSCGYGAWILFRTGASEVVGATW